MNDSTRGAAVPEGADNAVAPCYCCENPVDLGTDLADLTAKVFGHSSFEHLDPLRWKALCSAPGDLFLHDGELYVVSPSHQNGFKKLGVFCPQWGLA